ncbi:zinc finger protein 26 isoform X7 [Plutella xylostella]|uniref:zinc finger protein 26 isoform X7 n=1 Tax=Plutella xylostella TaxID=51655 RepID=UPI002032CF91|nr:zinc finger protein 26 isoform X7 [Plutella xylostella]
MDVGKSSSWPPGPTVCRCCLAEGCYKDISTEYFWMGKREVYAEMLTETFDLAISYAQSAGTNSNSRLICEPCISRLRDASEFKRQVSECERMFTTLLEPGSSGQSGMAQVTLSRLGKDVKVERVKVKKEDSEDDDDDDMFAEPFGDDDDDDDADDEPLTNLATKIPKKEAEDDIFGSEDKPKPAEKRKATVKAKAVPAKKAKATVTKAKGPAAKVAKPQEKKKRGRKSEEIQIKLEVESETETTEPKLDTDRTEQRERRETYRNNITLILQSCTACPFKYRRGTYLCFYCDNTFLEPEKLREHTSTTHSDVQQTYRPRKYEPVKIDFVNTTCKLCGAYIENYDGLKVHLSLEHGKLLDCSHEDSVLPYKLTKDMFCCQVCGKRYEMFLSLHKHMNEHYERFICETCGKKFVTAHRMVNHARTHQRGCFPCKLCSDSFPTYSNLHAHIARVHKSNKRYKCPICDEKFTSYKHRLNHLRNVHGKKLTGFPCPSCPKVFDLCSQRTAHVRFRHLQERNHVCPVCGMKFFTNYELQEHSVKHGGERIYQCDVCKKAYARLKTLREHMRIHNNDRRFVCLVCGHSFIQNCSLKHHMRVHHPAQFRDLFKLTENT